MVEKKFKMPKEKIREYYENYFKPVEFGKLVGLKDFDRREIACLDYPGGKKDFDRNFRFNSLKDFMTWVAPRSPFKLYFGAVYQTRWKGSIQAVPWEHNSLHFDIDVNDSDLMRRGGICACGNSEDKNKRKKICTDCFQIVKEAAIFLIETLHEDFGIDKKGSVIYFSGSRGLHVHYPSTTMLGVSENDDKLIRKNLINYLGAVKEMEVDDSKIVDGERIESVKIEPRIAKNIPATTLYRRIGDLVYKWFFTRSPEKTIKKSKVPPLVVKIITEMFDQGKNMDEIMIEIVTRDLMSKQRIERMRQAVMTYRYPRYDGGATYDVRKVMKVPDSIDCSSGFIVSKVDDIEGVDLSDMIHVSNYVNLD